MNRSGIIHGVRSLGRLTGPRLYRMLLVLSALSLLVSLLDVGAIVLLLPFVEALSKGNTTLSVGPLDDISILSLLVVVVALFVTKSLLSAAVRWWATGITNSQSARTSSLLYEAYLDAPLSFHDRHNSAGLLRNLSHAVPNVYIYMALSIVTALSEIATLAALVVVIVVVAPLPAMASAVYFVAAGLVYGRIVQRRIRSNARQSEQLFGDTLLIAGDGFDGFRELRVRGTQEVVAERYRRQRADYGRRTHFTVFAAELSRYFLEVVFIAGFGVTAAVVLLSDSGDDSLRVLGLALATGFRALPSISRILASTSNIRVGMAALDLVVADLDELGLGSLDDVRPSGAQASGAAISSGAVDIEFDGVGYRYDTAAANALHGVSFRVPAGTSTGIVGPSGSGKSTIIDLICGLRRESSGVIKVNGAPLGHNVRSWQDKIGFVPQDIHILDASIADNVAYGLPVDRAQVRGALERAQLLSFVETFSEGMDAPAGERGLRISGGQRQRLGLARALYRNPSVLVLDEATSALDSETESEIAGWIASLSGHVTVIVVAHRIQSIMRCDQVVYLDGGHVRATGSFDHVRSTVPEFERMIRLSRGVGSESPDGFPPDS